MREVSEISDKIKVKDEDDVNLISKEKPEEIKPVEDEGKAKDKTKQKIEDLLDEKTRNEIALKRKALIEYSKSGSRKGFVVKAKVEGSIIMGDKVKVITGELPLIFSKMKFGSDSGDV